MLEKVFSKIFYFATLPTKTVEGAAAVLAASILLSRILGLIRYRLLAAEFGDRLILLDSFLAASIVPEIIFEVLIFGSISVAFIPIFSQLLARGQKERAWQLARTLVGLGLVLFCIFAAVLILTADKVGFLVAPGLVSKSVETEQLIGNLIRVMVISQLFFLFGIFATSILQSYQNFLVPALAPAVYNLGIIFGIVALSSRFGIFGPALGMIIGSFAFFVIQLVAILKFGSLFGGQFKFPKPDVLKVTRLAWPRVVGLAAARGIDWINIALASLTGAGSIVAFNFAQTLAAVPIGLFGSSVAQAALPTLSAQFAKNDLVNFKKTFILAVQQIFFFTLPTVSILAILRVPAVRLVFGAGNFPWETTLLAGRVLIILSVAIIAQAMLLLLVRAFYALEDAKTPIVLGLASFSVNVILAVVLILLLKLPVTFLAAAFTLSNLLYAASLFYFLNKRVGGFDWGRLIIPIVKMGIAAGMSALIVYIPFKVLDFVLNTSKTLNVLILSLASGSSGLLTYFILNLIFGVHQAKMIHNFFSRLKFPKKILSVEIFKG